jgi:hypothetical protein
MRDSEQGQWRTHSHANHGTALTRLPLRIVRIPRCALGSPTTPSFLGLFGTPIRMLTTGGPASDTGSLMLVEVQRIILPSLLSLCCLLLQYVPLVRAKSLLLRLVLSLPSPSFLPTPPFSSCLDTFLFVFFGQDQK